MIPAKMRIIVVFTYVFLGIFCSQELTPSLNEMKSTLLVPLQQQQQAQLFTRMQSYIYAQKVDSAIELVQKNRYDISRLCKNLLLHAAFEMIEGEKNAAMEQFKVAENIAVILHQQYQDHFYQYLFNLYTGLSIPELRHKLTIEYLFHEGYHYYEKYQYDKKRLNMCQKIFQKALKLSQKINDIEGQASAYSWLYEVFYQLGNQEKSQKLLQQAWSSIDRISHKKCQQQLLFLLGKNHYEQGYFLQALTAFQQCFNLAAAQEDPVYKALSGEWIGVSYKTIGQYNKAIEALEQAQKFYHDTGDLPGETRVLLILCNINKHTGNYETVSGLLQNATRLFHGTEDSLNWSRTLTSIGLLYAENAAYDTALYYLHKALSVKLKYDDVNAIINTSNSIASVYISINKPDLAMNYLKLAAKYSGQVNSINTRTRLRLVSANFYIKAGMLDHACQEYNQVLQLTTQTHNVKHQLMAYEGLGTVCYLKNYLDSSSCYFIKEMNLAKKINNFQSLTNALHWLGKVHKAWGKFKEAEKYFDQAIEQVLTNLKPRASDNLELLAFTRYHELYQDAIQLAFDDLKDNEKVYFYMEIARYGALLKLFNSVKTAASITGELDSICSHVPGLSTTTNFYSNQFLNSLISYKKTITKFNRFQELLPAQTSLLEFYLTDDCVYILIIDKFNTYTKKLTVRSDSITGLIEDFRQNIKLRGAHDLTDVNFNEDQAFKTTINLSNQLYNLLIQPLEPFLENTRRLVIIPDGAIAELPFCALTRDGTMTSPNFMMNRYAILMAPCSNYFLRCYQQSQKNSRISAQSSMLYVTIARDSICYIDRLPIELSGYYDTLTTLGGPIVRKQDVERLLRNRFALVHFDTRCTSIENNPLSSYLIFSKPDGPVNFDTGSGPIDFAGEFLTARELLAFDLTNVALVTLTAVESAPHNRSITGLTGLSYALLGSGASAVLTPLWNQDDRFLYETMRNFYLNLTNPDILPEESLQLTNKKVIKLIPENLRIKYPHPYYWAAFVINGYIG